MTLESGDEVLYSGDDEFVLAGDPGPQRRLYDQGMLCGVG
jgi:hypothetical protein